MLFLFDNWPTRISLVSPKSMMVTNSAFTHRHHKIETFLIRGKNSITPSLYPPIAVYSVMKYKKLSVCGYSTGRESSSRSFLYLEPRMKLEG